MRDACSPKRLPSMALAQPHLPFWGTHGKDRPPEAQEDTMERATELQIPDCHGARLFWFLRARWGSDARFCGPWLGSPKETQVEVCVNLSSTMV